MNLVKPFLKWAGGKTQLLGQIEQNLPHILSNDKFTYVEPFVGSGAVLFWILQNFPNLKKAIINDINEDLINTYQTIAENPKNLISILEILQEDFHNLESDEDKKKEYYYQVRKKFNDRKSSKIEQSALFIFLNRTCFNGLYRVNRKNEYNVPMGSYKRPTICDTKNILAVSEILQKVEILCGDFEQTFDYVTENTFFYFDPPYKPLSETSNFNTYVQDIFDDNEQIRLKNFCAKLDKYGYQWIVSNSDVKNYNVENHFFDDLYSDFQIKRVLAKRNINSNAQKRGTLSELLITNYPKL